MWKYGDCWKWMWSDCIVVVVYVDVVDEAARTLVVMVVHLIVVAIHDCVWCYFGLQV